MKDLKDEEQKEYKTIVKSSFLVGGAQIFNVGIGIVRNKVLAVLLGTAGMGVLGIYTSLITLLGSINTLGIGSSGVKQIAEAQAEGSQEKLSYASRLIRRILIIAGITITLLVIALCKPIAQFSFESNYRPEFLTGIIVLAICCFFDALSCGEKAILQGFRELKRLAAGQILSSTIGTAGGIVIIYFYGLPGIPFSLLFASVCIYIVARLQVGKLGIVPHAFASLGTPEKLRERKELLYLGGAVVITTVAGNIESYIERILIIQNVGLNGVGIYQSAWTLVAASFNVVLMAIITDFYPRLVAVVNTRSEANRVVNQQVNIALIAILPIVLFIYVYCPLILQLLYSKAFLDGVNVTQWLVLGCVLRVISWPMGYILMANGRKMLFVVVSVFLEIVHLPIVYFGMKQWGIDGIGISYVIAYIVAAIIMSAVSAYYFQFRFNRAALFSMALTMGVCILLVLLNYLFHQSILFYIIGSILFIISSIRVLYAFQKIWNVSIYQKLFKKRT